MTADTQKPTIEEQIAAMVERRDNALIIAENKTGTDRDEWLQDAAEYDAVIASLRELAAIKNQPVPVEPRRSDQCGIHYDHQPHDYCNGTAAPLIPDEELISRGYVTTLQSSLQAAQQERDDAKIDGMLKAAEICRKRADEITHENCVQDMETGAWEGGSNEIRARIEMLDEMVDIFTEAAQGVKKG